jgi:hypothetical protein
LHVYLTFDDLKEHRFNQRQQNPLVASVFAFASFDVPIKKMPQVVANISGITSDSIIDTPCTLRGSMGKIKISEFEFEKMSRSK